MATSQEIRNTALRLATEGLPDAKAIRQLLVYCGDHRVALVIAKQRLSEMRPAPTTNRARELLDYVLVLGAWTA
jgi:hypothetical protein